MVFNFICTWLRFSNFLSISIKMPKDTIKYYYAVGKGRQTGVFNTWAECSKQISGITNAKFKKFPTYEEAEAFVQQYQSPHKTMTPAKDRPSPTQTQIRFNVSRSGKNEEEVKPAIMYDHQNQFSLGIKIKDEFNPLEKEEVFIPLEVKEENMLIQNRKKLKDSEFYHFDTYYIKKDRPESLHVSLQELENILKSRKNLSNGNQDNISKLTKELLNNNNSPEALKKALQLIFQLIGLSVNPQMETQPSTSIAEVNQTEPNKPIITKEANQIDLAEVKAVNLRLDAFEKRFDDCLKQMGAISQELENLKGQVKSLQNNFQDFITKEKNNVSVPESNEGRSYKHRSASIQQAFQEAMEPVCPSSSSRRDDDEAGTSRSQKRLKRKRSPSRRSKEESSQNEEFQPSTSNNFEISIKKEKEVKQEKADLQTFIVGEDEYVHVYTDGCCHFNGTPKAKAGIGIWFGDNHSMNVSAPLDGNVPTNNNAEIQAARVAIELATKAGITKLKIFTDSGFTISCATEWMKKWKVNGWKTNSNKNVINEVELKKLDEAMKSISVKWEKVEAHRGVIGNEMADKLANQGALRYRPKN